MAQINLDTLPRSLEEALATGSKTFYTGQPCSKGHVAFRYVDPRRKEGSACSTCRVGSGIGPVDHTGETIAGKKITGLSGVLPSGNAEWAWECCRCGASGSSTWPNLRHMEQNGVVYCKNCKTSSKFVEIPIGAMFRNLRVLSKCEVHRSPGGHSVRKVWCECVDCGEVKLRTKGSLLSRTNLCRCQTKTVDGKSHTPEGVMYLHAKRRAKEQGVPFSIRLEDIAIPTHCPVLGIRLVRAKKGKGFTDTSPSLDKIIPALGYVPGNIAVISGRANRLKNDGTADELMAIAEWMAKQKGARLAA